MSDLLSQVGSESKERYVRWIKKSIKGYKIWDPREKKFILSRDVTFDEASMMKPTNSQQVESETTDMISQHAKSDVTSPSLERSVSFEVIPSVTREIIR